MKQITKADEPLRISNMAAFDPHFSFSNLAASVEMKGSTSESAVRGLVPPFYVPEKAENRRGPFILVGGKSETESIR